MPKPSIPRCSDCGGFTVVEMLVGLTLGLAVAMSVVGLSISSKNLVDADRTRVRLNHTLRAARQFVVNDVYQAGERLPGDFPALEILDGASGASDTLVVRRALIDTVLPVCEDVTGSDTSFAIAQTVSPPTGCDPLDDDDMDGWPDNLQAWRAARVAAGGEIQAYIYNPTNGLGEFFTYISEDRDLHDVTAAPGTVWQHSYPEDDQCRVYILEQRRYAIEDDVMRLVINDDTGGAANLVDGIVDFQAIARFTDGTRQSTLGYVDLWDGLEALEITIETRAMNRNRPVEAGWTMDVMPRNVLSNR